MQTELNKEELNFKDPEATPEPRLYDLSMIISIEKEDNTFEKELIGIFMETMPESVTELRNAAQNKNMEQIRKTAHRMKSSLDLFGVHSLKDTITKLETTANEDEIDAHIDFLDKTLKKVCTQLKELI
jgi:HPt (histidine-containing phosphotransfer) domain-containing protein